MNRSSRRALDDIVEGGLSIRYWHLLAVQDLRQRYRRSSIGPWWLTISMGVQIATMGTLVGMLFSHPFEKYLPYVAAGYILWSFFSTILNEGSMCFVSQASNILHLRRPLFSYVMHTLWRNVIILGHTICLALAVALLYGRYPSYASLLLVPGLILTAVNASWLILLLGTLSARFRDIPMMIANALTVLFWLTPVVYYPDQLGEQRFLVELNPLTHMIDILRLPLLGEAPPALSWVMCVGLAVAGWIVTFAFHTKFRCRISYWL